MVEQENLSMWLLEEEEMSFRLHLRHGCLWLHLCGEEVQWLGGLEWGEVPMYEKVVIYPQIIIKYIFISKQIINHFLRRASSPTPPSQILLHLPYRKCWTKLYFRASPTVSTCSREYGGKANSFDTTSTEIECFSLVVAPIQSSLCARTSPNLKINTMDANLLYNPLLFQSNPCRFISASKVPFSPVIFSFFLPF